MENRDLYLHAFDLVSAYLMHLENGELDEALDVITESTMTVRDERECRELKANEGKEAA